MLFRRDGGLHPVLLRRDGGACIYSTRNWAIEGLSGALAGETATPSSSGRPLLLFFIAQNLLLHPRLYGWKLPIFGNMVQRRSLLEVWGCFMHPYMPARVYCRARGDVWTGVI